MTSEENMNMIQTRLKKTVSTPVRNKVSEHAA